MPLAREWGLSAAHCRPSLSITGLRQKPTTRLYIESSNTVKEKIPSVLSVQVYYRYGRLYLVYYLGVFATSQVWANAVTGAEYQNKRDETYASSPLWRRRYRSDVIHYLCHVSDLFQRPDKNYTKRAFLQSPFPQHVDSFNL